MSLCPPAEVGDPALDSEHEWLRILFCSEWYVGSWDCVPN